MRLEYLIFFVFIAVISVSSSSSNSYTIFMEECTWFCTRSSGSFRFLLTLTVPGSAEETRHNKIKRKKNVGTLRKKEKAKKNINWVNNWLSIIVVYYIIEGNISLAQRNDWWNERRKKIIILWVSSELNNKSTMHIQQSYDEILPENPVVAGTAPHSRLLLWDIGQLNHLCGESEKTSGCDKLSGYNFRSPFGSCVLPLQAKGWLFRFITGFFFSFSSFGCFLRMNDSWIMNGNGECASKVWWHNCIAGCCYG